MNAVFEQLSRRKVRFDTTQGQLSVEDLWDLPLSSSTGKANLDTIAVSLHKRIKDEGEVSFVNTPAKTSEETQLKFDAVKHIIEVRMEENKRTLEAKANKEKKQQILALIAQKENEKLAGTSMEELKALAETL